MKKTTNSKSPLSRISLLIALIMVFSVFSPVYAREYYNYESRYIINLSEDSYSKMSKVNENLMSIIYDDGVSMTFTASNYYDRLSDEDKNPELTSDDYSVGEEVFSATYNDATYMKDEYFTKRLSNVNGNTEMEGVRLTEVNGFNFWELTYNYLGEPTEEMLRAAEEGTASSDEDKDETSPADTAEGENNESEPADTEPETPEIREDGLVIIGEGRIYFTIYKGYEYRIHMMNKQGPISDYPDMENIFGTINLGLRQSNLMMIMWIVIAVLCAICLILIIFTLTRKSPKKLAKLRLQAGLDENGNALPQTLAIEGAVEFDEEEQLKNNELVNAKLEMLAKENSPEEPAVLPVSAEDDTPDDESDDAYSDESDDGFDDDLLPDDEDIEIGLVIDDEDIVGDAIAEDISGSAEDTSLSEEVTPKAPQAAVMSDEEIDSFLDEQLEHSRSFTLEIDE